MWRKILFTGPMLDNFFLSMLHNAIEGSMYNEMHKIGYAHGILDKFSHCMDRMNQFTWKLWAYVKNSILHLFNGMWYVGASNIYIKRSEHNFCETVVTYKCTI